MKARQLMVRPAGTVCVRDSLEQAAELMRDHDCRAVAVIDRGTVVAMLTDRDICMAALRTGRSLGHLPVGHAIGPALHACAPEDDMWLLEEVMARHHLRCLPVLDADRRLLGVVHLDDLTKAVRLQADLIDAPPDPDTRPLEQ